ncbi:MAG: hypothetical protein ACRDTJ_08470 [Pseudonocardiaceae bacterium]
MTSIEQLAGRAFRAAEPRLPVDDARDIAGDLAAGEHEIAMITLVEVAPSLVDRSDVDELERLARGFDAVDGPIALRVIAAWRRSSLLSA